MSIYAEYKHGLITEAEFYSAARAEVGGCRPCNFYNEPTRERCENCTSGDYWNEVIDWSEEDEE